MNCSCTYCRCRWCIPPRPWRTSSMRLRKTFCERLQSYSCVQVDEHRLFLEHPRAIALCRHSEIHRYELLGLPFHHANHALEIHSVVSPLQLSNISDDTCQRRPPTWLWPSLDLWPWWCAPRSWHWHTPAVGSLGADHSTRQPNLSWLPSSSHRLEQMCRHTICSCCPLATCQLPWL